MPARMTRDARREDTRRRLLDAARRVFLRRGFHGASLGLVADEAGFTKGAVYSRFESKADLFLALLDERVSQRIAEMDAVAAAEHGTVDLGTAIGRQWDAKLRQDEAWSLATLEFRLHAARDPAVNRRYGVVHGRLRRAVAALIERQAAEAGETLPLPVEDVARGALALGTGAVLERAVDGDAFPADLSERMNRAIVKGLRSEAVRSSPRRPPRRRSA
jgi:AcrR family transcriptional regulator